jgi:hypothetical protein
LFPEVRATRAVMLMTNFGTPPYEWYKVTVNEPETISGATMRSVAVPAWPRPVQFACERS